MRQLVTCSKVTMEGFIAMSVKHQQRESPEVNREKVEKKASTCQWISS
jgi:hypothetical protein